MLSLFSFAIFSDSFMNKTKEVLTMQVNGVYSNFSVEQSLKKIANEMNKKNSIDILDRLLQQDFITKEEYINDLRKIFKS